MIFVITGQTATGKTKLALDLAQKYNGELVNCDSRQVYKYLDIITGKDKPDNTKIWMYDIVDPKNYFSSFDYVQLAIPVIQNIIKRKKTPIIIGGTYLYLKHLLYGIDTHTPPNWQLRNELENKTVTELQKTLKSLNVQTFNQMNQSDRNNPRRLMRKIELLKSPFNPVIPALSPVIPAKAGIYNMLPKLKIEFIGLRFKDKAYLISAINNRVENRLNQGAIVEVKQLLKQGFSENDPGLKTIGYQQIIQFLNGKLSKEIAINQWITKEIQYAKRQYTFMKKDPNIQWREV